MRMQRWLKIHHGQACLQEGDCGRSTHVLGQVDNTVRSHCMLLVHDLKYQIFTMRLHFQSWISVYCAWRGISSTKCFPSKQFCLSEINARSINCWKVCFFSHLKLYEGQREVSEGKGSCHYIQSPAFDLQNPPVEGEKRVLKVVFWLPLMCFGTGTPSPHTHTHSHTNKWVLKIFLKPWTESSFRFNVLCVHGISYTRFKA